MEIKFIPKPGQIDYTNVRYAPTINCIVKCQDEFLLVQRSLDSNFYPGYWNGISGFLDDNKDINQKVEEELFEELNIEKDAIVSIKIGKLLYKDEKEYNKTWIVFPILVEIKSKDLNLNFENHKFQWFKINEIDNIIKTHNLMFYIEEILTMFFNF
jgi:isopentenyldiphosphate isomerase